MQFQVVSVKKLANDNVSFRVRYGNVFFDAILENGVVKAPVFIKPEDVYIDFVAMINQTARIISNYGVSNNNESSS
jgi:hypothetical protein